MDAAPGPPADARRYLHVVPDDKFIDAAWASFEAAAPGCHDFVLAGHRGTPRFVRDAPVRRLPLRDALAPAFLQELPRYAAVFLHSLTRTARLVVDAAPAQTAFCWIGWGNDYYHLIRSPRSLLLERTRALAANAPAARRRIDSALHWLGDWRDVPTRLAAARTLARIGAGKADEDALLAKISLFAPVTDHEYELVRAARPGFAARAASWNYPLGHVFDGGFEFDPSRKQASVIVGNSATPECNHVDAFEWLAASGFDGLVHCPLSYGDSGYAAQVQRAGRALLGDRFRPITAFLSLPAYADLLAQAPFLVMNHVRQQGLGNMVIALMAGTRLVLREENPLQHLFAELGVATSVVGNVDFALREDPATVARNRRLMHARFGPEAQLQRTRDLLAQARALRAPRDG